MGILDRLRVPDPSVAAAIGDAITAGLSPDSFPITTPWSGSATMQRIVFDDVFGKNIPQNTRASAMRLGPIARGRNLLCTTIARLPAVVGHQEAPTLDAQGVMTDDGFRPLPEQPAWINSAADGSTPQHRIVWTVDDLIFYGASLWWRVNDPVTGFPTDVGRYAQDEWTIDADNHLVVNGVTVTDSRSVILITGFHEGILSFGVDVLQDAAAINSSVRSRIKNPAPQLELHQTGGDDLSDDEITDLVADWAAARQGANGGVAYTNEFIELKEHGASADAQLMIEGRNASAVDQARILGVSASRVDATADKASLTYETTVGKNGEFVDFDLGLYVQPIAARLSLDDVTPAGTKVRFQLPSGRPAISDTFQD